jgi:uncharacterized membrane protein
MLVKKWQRLGFSLIISSVLLGSFGAANAYPRSLNFCNKTNVNVTVAFGYEPAGSNNTQTKGWRNLQACQCVTLFSEDVRATELYYYVIKSGSGIEGAFNEGRAPLCVRDGKFQVGPSNANQKRCTDSGGRWVNFTQVIAQKESLSVNFGSGGNCRD